MNLSLGETQVFRPWKALMFYRHEQQGTVKNELLFEHDAYIDGGKVRLGEGRLVPEAGLVQVVKDFTKMLNVKPRVLHPRVLVDVPGMFAWWMPAGRRIHYFDVDRFRGEVAGRERLQGRKAELPHPALVFVQRGFNSRTVHVYALKESARPDAQTELQLAPFLNVNSTRNRGWICWGSTAMPGGSIQDTFTQVEEAFFGSTFSHMNEASMVSLAEGRTMYEFLADLCDAPPETFPLEVLKPVGSLDTVLQELSQGAQG